MRAIIYFLFFAIIGGNSQSYGSSYNKIIKSSFNNLSENQKEKFTNEDHFITFLEYTDIDLEEEYSGSDDITSTSENNFFVGKYSLVNTLYSSHSHHLVLNYFDKRYKIFLPLTGNSCPIYITQQVLRI